MDDNDLGSYVNELTNTQGVAVITVSDGWVLVFTKDMLKNLLKQAKDSDKVMVQVKSSARLPKN